MMGFDYAAKIRAMLAMADSHEAGGNEGLAANIRNQVEVLMRKWKVEQEDMLAEDPTSAEPTHLSVEVQIRSTEVGMYYYTTARILAEHVGARINVDRIAGGYRMTVVGYDNDLKYWEFLWTSAFLMFSTKIDPRWESEKAEAENIFFMRQAGIKRAEIADKAWGVGAGLVAANRSKVQRIYLSEANKRGEAANATGLGFQAKDYRLAYARAFTSRLEDRLRDARDAADTTGGVLVLAGRAERITEAFYVLFPDERPSQDVATPYVAPNADCAKCKAAASGFCTNHRWLKPRVWSDADERRWQNKHNGPSARAGRSGGETAADGVLLRGTASPRAKRVEASNQALEG